MKTEMLKKERVLYNALAVRVADNGDSGYASVVLKTEHD